MNPFEQTNSPRAESSNPDTAAPKRELSTVEEEDKFHDVSIRDSIPRKLGDVNRATTDEKAAGTFGPADIEVVVDTSRKIQAFPSDMEDDEDEKGHPGRSTKQGTLQGVFLPCLQNIMGIILFLRLPAITGEAGIAQALLIVLIGCSTTFLTTLSMNAIATNGKIKTGGPYFMISRTLGPATGGAVGVLFYLATTLSASMYILGAVEAFLVATGAHPGPEAFSMRMLGFVLLVFLVAINWFGLSYVSKTALVFLCFVLFTIMSMFLGILTASAR